MTATRRARGSAAFHRGHGAERRAAWLLRLKLYRILAVNWRCPSGEIDLIARRGKTLAMVEVKQRAGKNEALASILPQQQRRLARAAGMFLALRPDLAALELRFDVIAFGRLGRPVHLPDAWRPDGS